jgi:archaellum component FlaC
MIDGIQSTRLTSSVSNRRESAVPQELTHAQEALDRLHHQMQHRRAEAMGSTLTAVVDVSRELLERVGALEVHAVDTNERLDRIDGRLDGIDGRLDGIDVRLDGIDVRLDGIDGRLDTLSSRLGLVEDEVRHLGGRIEYMIGLVVRDETRESGPPVPPDAPRKERARH